MMDSLSCLVCRPPNGGVFGFGDRATLHSYDAAIDWQIDARDEAAFVGRQEQNGRGNLFGPSNPLHWRHGDEPVLHRADVRAELPFEEMVTWSEPTLPALRFITLPGSEYRESRRNTVSREHSFSQRRMVDRVPFAPCLNGSGQ